MPPIMFQGYPSITRNTHLKPVGRDGAMLPVVELEDTQWEAEGAYSPEVIKLKSLKNDQSFYYRHGLNQGFRELAHLSEVGSYQLAQDLGIPDVVAKADLVELSSEETRGKTRTGKGWQEWIDLMEQEFGDIYYGNSRVFKSTMFALRNGGLGSVQQGISGPVLADIFYGNEKLFSRFLDKISSDKKGLNSVFGLYIYTRISHDFDKWMGNVIYEEANNQVVSIDNETAGRYLPYQALKFPKALISLIDQKPLPEPLCVKVNQFIQAKQEEEKRLAPYFSLPGIQQMFEAAKALLKKPLVSFTGMNTFE